MGGGESSKEPELNPNGSDTTAPTITSSNTNSVYENQTNDIDINASDNNSTSLKYEIISGDDSALFDINDSTGLVTFKLAPDFEASPTKTTFTFTAKVSDEANNSSTQNISITLLDVNEIIPSTVHYIKSAIYDDNSTSNVNDDTLYVYFNKDIKSESISSDMSANYDINGTGAIGSASLGEYNTSIFYRHKISLNSNGTASIKFDDNLSTKISLKQSQITDVSNNYPLDLNQTAVKKFNTFARLKTGQSTSYVANDDGNTTRGIAQSFTQNNDGTITHNSTNLMWQDDNDAKTIRKTWQEAKDYCEAKAGTYDDWYLPSIEELVSITHKGRYNPSINTAFLNVASSLYWSSTSVASNTSDAWSVYFYNGDDGWDAKAASNYVRCVRPADT